MSAKLKSVDSENDQTSPFVRFLSEPLSKHGWPTWLVYTLAIIGFIYILNPTFGILEFIPDNLPLIGNLDDSVAVMLILAGIIEFTEGRKRKKNEKKNSEEK